MSGPDAITLEILRHRLAMATDEASITIARVSGSQVATEANDFNCALMAADGRVVVCGTYTLVQVVSLNSLVEDILERYGDNPGIGPDDMFMTNDPYVGAPHQPDVMVVAPIFADDELIAWSGSVVHQSDVGGTTPGSIVIGARSIFEETIPMAPVKIVERGRLRRDIEREYLIRSRSPELNALDLHGQVAANRVMAEAVLGLGERFGVDAVTGTFERVVAATERQFRERLSALPDGRWRHESFVEGDGLDDRVYAVRLTMTKRGDALELDFRESDAQAPAGINCAEPTTRSFAMSAVMAIVGHGIPWAPAGFWPAVDIRTVEGTVVHARWPAGVAMAVNAAGQEVRSCVTACLARLLDAAEGHDDELMACCVSSSPAQMINGTAADGRPFTTMLLDGMIGGGGARGAADGTDMSGTVSSPGGACANIEVNELHYPMLYLWRRERPDSGGPGRWRGGTGAEHAYRTHRTDDDVEVVLFGHGLEQPTATGVAGGEPALPTGVGIVGRAVANGGSGANGIDADGIDSGTDPAAVYSSWTDLPAKAVRRLAAGDLMASCCSGGGGLGDPLVRPVAEVLADVREGVVSMAGAARDYGVVVLPAGTLPVDTGLAEVDEAATDERRLAMRRERLAGQVPARRPAVRPSTPDGGRRVSGGLAVVDGSLVCRFCASVVGPADQPVRGALVCREEPVGERWLPAQRYHDPARFVVRHYACPACATQHDVEVARAGEPPLVALDVTAL